MNDKKHPIRMNEDGQLSFGEITKTFSDLPSFKTPKWEIIKSEEKLEKLAANLKDIKAIGLDIETTGLDPYFSEVRLIQISPSSDFTYILDMQSIENLDKIKKIFEAKKPVKVIHNAVFEQKFLKHHFNINLGSVFDTMLANKLIYNGIYRRNSLQDVVKDELGLFLDKEMQTSAWGKNELDSMQLNYAAKDSAILLILRKKQIKKIVELGLVNIAKIEFDCTKAVTALELNGIFVDHNLIKKFREDIEKEIEKLLVEIENFFGKININSHKQVAYVLSRKGIYTESTSESELKKYAKEYKGIQAFLDYKSLYKRLSSTIEPLENNLNPITNRVHSSYNQLGATSGRMSCYNPNLQNIPRGEIRSIFKAPKGRKLIIADYSQIELRIIAEISNDSTLINAFQNKQDIHNITASIITHKDINQISKEDRQKAKAVNFGLVYGMGAKGLVKYANNSFNIDMTNIEAEEIYYKFFEKYDGIKRWHNEVKSKSSNIEYLETLSGRKRFYDSDKRYYSELFNTPVQGTGADILKLALVFLQKEFNETSTLLVNTVHDEVVIECDEVEAENIAKRVNYLMVEAGKQFVKSVPIIVDVNISNDWSEK